MKNIVLMLGTMTLGIIVLMIVITINGRMNRSMELKSNLSSIVEESMENMMLNPKYSIHNANEFVADLIESLSVTIDSVSDVKVDILDCDIQKGLLSVKVTLLYVHPNGMPGTVSCERLAIFDKKTTNIKEQHRVRFYVGTDIYKEYVVGEGTVLNCPVAPILSGATFLGWLNGNDDIVDFSKPITEDANYYAGIEGI